jgi:formate hydrogenlyase subunit 3/multisubunit Na+/H+ antiporter MnhD subunit
VTIEGLLLIAAWLVPLAIGLVQVGLYRRFAPIAPFAAIPALIAALVVPRGTVLDVPFLLLDTRFMLDETGQVFLLFTAILYTAAGIFAGKYLEKDERRAGFFGFFLLAMAGNIGAITAGDMLSFYMWFALMSFASYGAVVHVRDENARKAGLVYIALVVVGEVLLFAALVFIAGTTDGAILFESVEGAAIGNLAAMLVLLSFGIKAGLIGLHMWLPLAHPAAPVPASAVLSGAMIKVGILGLLRYLHPEITTIDWGAVLIVGGLVTMVYGALIGVSQVNPKTVLAYSSISQMGFILIGVGSWVLAGEAGESAVHKALLGVLIYAMSHALAKGALFMGVTFAGASRLVPFILLIPALALTGLPFFSGAIAKYALKSALPESWEWIEYTWLSVGAVGTTLLMARYLYLIWFSPKPYKQPTRILWTAWLALIVCTVGLLFIWEPARYAVEGSLKPDKLVSGTVPVLIGIALAAAAWFVTRGRALRLPLVPAGDLLIPIQRVVDALIAGVLGLLDTLSKTEDKLMSGVVTGRSMTMHRLNKRIERLEFRLRADWVVVGVAILLLGLGVLVAIAAAG